MFKTALKACKGFTGQEQYNCYEHQAVQAVNPEICRLAGMYIDDMCLQAVYEAANDPSICDRIYLQGVVPNCRAYYTRRTPTPFVSPKPPTDLLPTDTEFVLPSTSTQDPTIQATVIPTNVPAPTSSPIPLFVFDQTSYDPDIYQPIELSHNPPLIARSDERVMLMFSLVNSIYCVELQRYCRLVPLLNYTYGEAESFESMPLTPEVINEYEFLVARLPATDRTGKPLRYYAEFSIPEASYTLRFPTAGTIDLFTASNLIPIELPVEEPVEPGSEVYTFFWGFGPDKVSSTIYSPYNRRVGPPALDVASDGSIALVDPVNERIIIFNPTGGIYSSVPLPFISKFNVDLAFDHQDRLMICDFQGEEDQDTGVCIPYCYRLLPGGNFYVSTPVYTKFPQKLTREHQVLDYYDSRLITPFSSEGQPNSREIQRHKATWQLPSYFVEGEDGLSPFLARFADIEGRLAFEIHSNTGLGTILGFEQTPQGYIMIFGGFEQIRAVWIDPSGNVLKDISLPSRQYSELSFAGRVAVARDGSLYVLSSNERGIEIHHVGSP